MGLEDFPDDRPGGRLENDRGDPPLSDAAFVILQQLVQRATENLEAADHRHSGDLKTAESQANFLIALTRFTLEELASDEAADLVAQAAAKTV